VKSLIFAAIAEDQKALDAEQPWNLQRGAGKMSEKQSLTLKEVQRLGAG